ncbi:class I SAM-dependent methyltransferase [Acinetobacter sp. ANC 5054]|uniref:class I SAM-dependent methyltransferase n=1 Tax=Acinetobacter sp. ANC 5054 TaxID=1977877 RepID=UPI00268A81F3
MAQEMFQHSDNGISVELPDVPSPIDLRNPEDALQWANEVNVKRPWRYEIFDFYVEQILKHSAKVTVLELGSGPGYLAKHVLSHCPHIKYTAFDFSEAMHELSKSKLITSELERAKFITGDFKQADWAKQLRAQSMQQTFDVIVIHQALHELRHKRYATAFHQAVKSLMHEDSIYFVCDHIFAPDAQQNNQLYMSVDEHLTAFEIAEFKTTEFIQNLKGLAVFKVQIG